MSDHEERRAAEAAQAIAKARDGITSPAVLEGLKITARWRRAKYEAYVAAGFNAGQALWLCTID